MKTQQKRRTRITAIPGQPNENQLGLPWGSGSMLKRRRNQWISYRDAQGRAVKENSGTDDVATARALLIERALEVAKARVAVLEQLRDEAQAASRTERRGEARNGGKPRAGRRALQGAAGVRGTRPAAARKGEK